MLNSKDPKHCEIMAVDWVNSLDIASCALVNSIHDLKTGHVVADIISWLKDHQIRGVQKNVESLDQAIKNWTIILKELQEITPPSLQCQPEDLIEDDQRLAEYLNFLSTIKKNSLKDLRNATAITKSSDSSVLGSLPSRKPGLSPAVPKKFSQDSPQKTPERTEIEAKPVSETLKQDLISWVEDLKVIKKNSINSEFFPNICRTGILFCDLINRLEGKNEVVKGVERNPKNRTQALANISKALEYLRTLPKMSSNYLWSGRQITDGNELVIWGLLEDIKKSYVAKRKYRCSVDVSRNESNNSGNFSQEPETAVLPKEFLQQKSRSLRSYSDKLKRASSNTQSFNSPKFPRNASSKSVAIRANYFYISEEMKHRVKEWVEALGIVYEPERNPYTDKLKNGVLLCELIQFLESESLKINYFPRSAKAICDNFDKAMRVFRKNHPEIPVSLINDPERLAENYEIVYALLYSLMPIFPNAIPAEYKDSPLPYGPVGIKKLENSIVNWVVGLNILQPVPETFEELVPEVKTGVLLCVVVSRVFSVKIPSIARDPRTQQSCMTNIRKALDVLKNLPQMSQKFMWSEKQIFNGSHGAILGLLEDIQRCADGLPPKKAEKNSKKEKPYLGSARESPKKSNFWKSIQNSSFNTTFGSASSPKSKAGKK